MIAFILSSALAIASVSVIAIELKAVIETLRNCRRQALEKRRAF